MVRKTKYEVVEDLGPVELRRYGPLAVAKVHGMGSGGFTPLFRYIQGNNTGGARVAMTAPVIQERDETTHGTSSERIAMTAPVLSDRDSMAFVLPEGYTVGTAPKPLDERVSIEEVPGRVLAVLRFSGRWTEQAFDRRSQQLLGRLVSSGVRTRGEVFSMVYNPPFTPPFLRRNEVAIEVDLE
jgi:hypothetical protein